MRRRIVGALAAALALAATPLPAYAAPGDPAPGWPTQHSGGSWSTAVSTSGRVHTVAHPVPGEGLEVLSLGSTYNGTWPAPTEIPGYGGSVRAGSGAYGIAVSHGPDSFLVSREFVGGRWTAPETIGELDQATSFVTNTDGDAVVVWRAPDGLMAGLHPRGATWTTLPVTGVPDGGYFAATINDAGKVTVVWAEATGTTTQAVRRTVLRPGATTWTAPQTLGTVSPAGGAPRIVTDGQGRETITAGDKLWRQQTTTSTPAYAFAVGQDAQLAAGTTDTRVVWPYRNGRYLSVRTRHFAQTSAGEGWGSTTTVWAKTYAAGVPLLCRELVNTGVGIAPAGRSYVAFGVVARGGCPRSTLRLVTLDRTSTPLNDVVVSSYGYGTTPEVAVNARGPVAVSFQADGADNGWGDTNYLRFFSR
ncbi:hypothetical protein [Promicromonospora sp. NPDC019610]|uniref:hypothetical protein n=1 Tax=Promicromonospora sp. NPDC019610 TaxID=3364405 RepID=UPI0037BBD890